MKYGLSEAHSTFTPTEYLVSHWWLLREEALLDILSPIDSCSLGKLRKDD